MALDQSSRRSSARCRFQTRARAGPPEVACCCSCYYCRSCYYYYYTQCIENAPPCTAHTPRSPVVATAGWLSGSPPSSSSRVLISVDRRTLPRSLDGDQPCQGDVVLRASCFPLPLPSLAACSALLPDSVCLSISDCLSSLTASHSSHTVLFTIMCSTGSSCEHTTRSRRLPGLVGAPLAARITAPLGSAPGTSEQHTYPPTVYRA
jgi:hypothetical protein